MQAPINQLRMNVCTKPNTVSTSDIFILIIEEISIPCSKVLKKLTVLSRPNTSIVTAQPKYSKAPVVPKAKPNFLMLM